MSAWNLREPEIRALCLWHGQDEGPRKGRPERLAFRAVPLEESYEEVLLGVGVKSGRSRARNLGVVCLSEVMEVGDVGWNLRSAEGSGPGGLVGEPAAAGLLVTLLLVQSNREGVGMKERLSRSLDSQRTRATFIWLKAGGAEPEEG